MVLEHLSLALIWLAYGLLHSLTASMGLKQWVRHHAPRWVPSYRLAFNLIALIALVPVAWVHFSIDTITLWSWTGWASWLANGLALLACLGFLVSTRYYDGAEFLGLRQWQHARETTEDAEAFTISPFHRYVRHPWYSFGLILIWTRDMDSALLTSATMITLYFWIGSLFEERKLIEIHGDRYRQYRENVAGLIPLPWKILSREDARRLTSV